MDKIKSAEERYPMSEGPYSIIKREAFIAGWDAALSTHQQLMEANQGLREALIQVYDTENKELIDSIVKTSLETYKL